jgi:hypothetical protein
MIARTRHAADLLLAQWWVLLLIVLMVLFNLAIWSRILRPTVTRRPPVWVDSGTFDVAGADRPTPLA